MLIRHIRILAFLLTLIFLTACLPTASPPPPLPSETPTPPPATATLTPVWFPPTATPTPLPTATLLFTPTLDLRPTVGPLIFTDDFSDPDLWTLNQSRSASSAMNNNQLTLALSLPKGYLFSQRAEPVLRDFYLEITASPSICRGEDEYGLLIRMVDSGNFYRFSLTCDGQARVDRVFKGSASSPQPLTLSGAIPPGAPSVSRLAVSAVGREMRFFVNDEYLFSVSDRSMPEGLLGVFIRASGAGAMTVNFSDLVVSQATK
jgi:hypothetical protein